MPAAISVILADTPGEKSAHIVAVLKGVHTPLQSPFIDIEFASDVPTPDTFQQIL